MAKATQLIRGTAATNDKYTGPEGSLSYCTDTHSLRVHDGTVVEGEVTNGTVGGFEVPVLVEYQRPTPKNNYTWYRKYSDGWVEQGIQDLCQSNNIYFWWKFPIKMKSGYYVNVSVHLSSHDTGFYVPRLREIPEESVGWYLYLNGKITSNHPIFIVEVKGYAA